MIRLQKQSDLGLHCLSRQFWQATSVRNLRNFTVVGCRKLTGQADSVFIAEAVLLWGISKSTFSRIFNKIIRL